MPARLLSTESWQPGEPSLPPALLLLKIVELTTVSITKLVLEDLPQGGGGFMHSHTCICVCMHTLTHMHACMYANTYV